MTLDLLQILQDPNETNASQQFDCSELGAKTRAIIWILSLSQITNTGEQSLGYLIAQLLPSMGSWNCSLKKAYNAMRHTMDTEQIWLFIASANSFFVFPFPELTHLVALVPTSGSKQYTVDIAVLTSVEELPSNTRATVSRSVTAERQKTSCIEKHNERSRLYIGSDSAVIYMLVVDELETDMW